MKIKYLYPFVLVGLIGCRSSALVSSSNHVKVVKCTIQTTYGGTEEAGISQTIAATLELSSLDKVAIDSIAYKGNVVALKPSSIPTRAVGQFYGQVSPKTHLVLGEKSAIHCLDKKKGYWLLIDSVEVNQPVYMPQMEHGE